MATLPDKQQVDGIDTREKIDGYLMRSGLASPVATTSSR